MTNSPKVDMTELQLTIIIIIIVMYTHWPLY